MIDEADPSETFARFFLENNHKLVNTVTLWTGDRELAKDIAQEVMASLASYRYEKPEVLMFKLAKQRLSRLPYIPSQLQPINEDMANENAGLSMPGVDEIIDARLASNRQLMEALRSLPVRQREVVVLQIACDLSVEQVAEILGISESSVKTHKGRGLKRLEERMASKPKAKEPGAQQPVGGTQSGY